MSEILYIRYSDILIKDYWYYIRECQLRRGGSRIRTSPRHKRFFISTVFRIDYESVALIPQALYKHMDLPPSTKVYIAPSMTTPKFLKSVRNQCLVYSFYLGLAGFFNTWLVTNFQPSLPKIAANITKNVTFLGIYIHLISPFTQMIIV